MTLISILYPLECVLSHVRLCKPLDYSPLGLSVHRNFQARILKWVAISFSRGSSWPRDWTHVFCVSFIAGGFFTAEPSGKPHVHQASHPILSHEHSLFSSVICKEFFWFVLHLSYLYGGQRSSVFYCHLYVPLSWYEGKKSLKTNKPRKQR